MAIRKVFLNPGHDPKFNGSGYAIDPGAVGSRTTEAEVVKKIGALVSQYLQAVGYETYIMQDDDLDAVCEAANQWDADIFVSIHCNSAENPAAEGTETFTHTSAGPNSLSTKLAINIDNQLVNSLDLYDRGIKSANFWVLRKTDMPAVLVETAFINNPKEEDKLINQVDEFAKAIARGISDTAAQV